MIRSFLLGTIAGGAAMWIWRDTIRAYVDDATHGVRSRTAERLQAAAQTVEGGLTGSAGPRDAASESFRTHSGAGAA